MSLAKISFTVNNLQCSVDALIPRDTTLNAYLRYYLGLTGTKAMCHEGGCGSCIVMVQAYRQPDGELEVFSVNSCLVLVFSCHGWNITTVEGVGNRKEGYGDVQSRLAHFNASQCGYCTPGWVMQIHSLLDKKLSIAELEQSFGSNTCRCTGYRPLMQAIHTFGTDADPSIKADLPDIEDVNYCKKANGICNRKHSIDSHNSDWSVLSHGDTKPIMLDFGERKFYKVFDENVVFDILSKDGYDSYMFVDGNTAKGIYSHFGSYEYPRVLIDISDIKSLKSHFMDQNLVIGANMSLEDTKKLFEEKSESDPDFSYLAELAKHIEQIAHIPVRKIGSLAGNLMIKHRIPSYPSDVFLMLSTIGAIITIRDASNNQVKLTLSEFLNQNMDAKLMLSIALPPLTDSYVFRSYKISPRNQNALAIVNAAFLVKLQDTDLIEEITIGYGNINGEFIFANNTEAYLKNKRLFNNSTLQVALKILSEEISPEDAPPKMSPAVRKKIALGLFYKFVLNICPENLISPIYRSGGDNLKRAVFSSHQDYQTHEDLYPLNEPVKKLESLIQCAGEAQYVNDMPYSCKDVFAAFVCSTIHSGQLDYIDAEEALEIPGVIALYTAKDIPGKNSFAAPGIQLQTTEEDILVEKDVKFYGQPVAIIVAISEVLAAQAAEKVKVSYKNVSKQLPVLTIDQAKRDSKRVKKSSESIQPKSKGTDVQKVIKGKYDIEGQYHYYLEPITCMVVPVDNGFEVFDSSQWIDLSQIAIARALNINESKVTLRVRRVGGGFGGKISRNVQASTACAIVASKLNRPCRIILPIVTNMSIAGKRLPCQTEFEVGVSNDGIIQYLNASVYEDKGITENEDILSYVTGGFPNCYDSDTWDVKTANVITDTPTNTFMRAPGDLEAIVTIEHIMERIAYELNMDPTDVRLANMDKNDNDIPQLIEELKDQSDYKTRSKNIKAFNENNRWIKKGIGISVMRFPVEYYGNYSAFVSVYRYDGTVTVTTGGIEVGQGVNTKAAQVCAHTLGIPLESVSVLPSYSFTAANNVFTGSSIVSESVSYAIIKACNIILDRLKPIKEKLTNPSWLDIIKEAGNQQVDLTAEYQMNDMEQDLQNYSAFAVAIMETELDVLTGRYQINRVDILEDVGLSANPQIDVGQVEGAFVQGIGYFTTEKLVFDKQTGKLLTNRSLNYHVPLITDIPAEFNVRLRFNSKNTTGVLGSKAVGEMGICTANVVMHALTYCITESRRDSGFQQWVDISVPFDTESIITALDTSIDQFLLIKK